MNLEDQQIRLRKQAIYLTTLKSDLKSFESMMHRPKQEKKILLVNNANNQDEVFNTLHQIFDHWPNTSLETSTNKLNDMSISIDLDIVIEINKNEKHKTNLKIFCFNHDDVDYFIDHFSLINQPATLTRFITWFNKKITDLDDEVIKIAANG